MKKNKKIELAIVLDKSIEFTKDIKTGFIIEKNINILTGDEVWQVVGQVEVMFAEKLPN